MPGVLEGIRVVEMGQAIAAPAGTAILADWGAEVIKVEPLYGELTRGFRTTYGVDVYIQGPSGEMSFLFEQFNRGKKGLAVDLRKPQGAALVHKLVANADVFVSNYEVSALQKLGMDYASLRPHNPRLVYALVTGYGTVGPDKDERGFDYTAGWARGGLQHLIGSQDPPPAQRPGFGDHIAAGHMVAGILGAVVRAQRTGLGQEIEVSLYRSAVYTLTIDMVTTMIGRPLPLDDRNDVANPLLNAYRTKDGRWLQFAMMQADLHWPAFCKAIERPELADDPRFNNIMVRMQNRGEVISIIDQAMATRTVAEWEPILRAHQCIFSRIQTPAEVVNDPQAQANGFFASYEHTCGSTMHVVASPVRFGDTPAAVGGSSPEVGQHTEEILMEIGYGWEDLAALSGAEVIR